MCLAIPGKVIELKGDRALLDFGGTRREVSIELMPDIRVGEYGVVHAGFVLERLDEQEANEMLAALEKMEALGALDG